LGIATTSRFNPFTSFNGSHAADQARDRSGRGLAARPSQNIAAFRAHLETEADAVTGATLIQLLAD